MDPWVMSCLPSMGNTIVVAPTNRGDDASLKKAWRGTFSHPLNCSTRPSSRTPPAMSIVIDREHSFRGPRHAFHLSDKPELRRAAVSHNMPNRLKCPDPSAMANSAETC